MEGWSITDEGGREMGKGRAGGEGGGGREGGGGGGARERERETERDRETERQRQRQRQRERERQRQRQRQRQRKQDRQMETRIKSSFEGQERGKGRGLRGSEGGFASRASAHLKTAFGPHPASSFPWMTLEMALSTLTVATRSPSQLHCISVVGTAQTLKL